MSIHYSGKVKIQGKVRHSGGAPPPQALMPDGLPPVQMLYDASLGSDPGAQGFTPRNLTGADYTIVDGRFTFVGSDIGWYDSTGTSIPTTTSLALVIYGCRNALSTPNAGPIGMMFGSYCALNPTADTTAEFGRYVSANNSLGGDVSSQDFSSTSEFTYTVLYDFAEPDSAKKVKLYRMDELIGTCPANGDDPRTLLGKTASGQASNLSFTGFEFRW